MDLSEEALAKHLAAAQTHAQVLDAMRLQIRAMIYSNALVAQWTVGAQKGLMECGEERPRVEINPELAFSLATHGADAFVDMAKHGGKLNDRPHYE